MPFIVPIKNAQALFPEYTFIAPLTPSEQKAAFHVKDHTGRSLCLKIISPASDRDRVEREIVALQALSHPNVVKLIEYTFSTKDGRPRHYSIEEFIEGEDLSDLLNRHAPLSLEDASHLFIPLCDGLNAVHSTGVVHRDLKPSNIRVRIDRIPVIIDFGIARHLMLPDLTSTGEGAALGTPVYFAPEQFVGTKHHIDHRTDIFALGILLYEALVGHHPFYQNGMTITNLEDAVCKSTDCLLNDNFRNLPIGWRSLLSRLLEKERARRPQSAADVAKLMQKLGGIK